MNNEFRSVVREFALSLSDGELEMLTSKLTHRMSGDMSDALNFISKNRRLDHLLAAAKSADEFYDLCDEMNEVLQQECRKKGLVLTKGPVARGAA
jgi:hypothetical protein